MSRRQSVLGIPGLPPTSTSSFSRTHSSNSSFSSTSTNAPNSGYLEALDESTMANRRTTMDTLTMGTRFGGEESLEAQLGRKERECEKLQDQVEALQAQLKERPPKSEINNLLGELRTQESLLNGFQRENEKAMRDVEKSKAREKVLEAELEKLLGPHWTSSLGIAASPTLSNLSSFGSSRGSLSHLSSPLPLPQSTNTPIRPSPLARHSHTSSSSFSAGGKSSAPFPSSSDHSHQPVSSTDNGELAETEEDAGDETFTGPEGDQTGTYLRNGQDWSAIEGRVRSEMMGDVEGVRTVLTGLERRMIRREEELRAIIEKAETVIQKQDGVIA